MLDTLEVELDDGEYISVICRYDDTPDLYNIIAIYTDAGDNQYFEKIVKALRINLQTGVIEQIENLEGIKCVNEGYGV